MTPEEQKRQLLWSYCPKCNAFETRPDGKTDPEYWTRVCKKCGTRFGKIPKNGDPDNNREIAVKRIIEVD